MSQVSKYRQLKDSGRSPLDVYLATVADRQEPGRSLRVIRHLFNLSLDEGLTVATQGDVIAFAAYRHLAEAGTSAREVYHRLKEDGFGILCCISVLRSLYGMTIHEVKTLVRDASS